MVIEQYTSKCILVYVIYIKNIILISNKYLISFRELLITLLYHWLYICTSKRIVLI